MRSLLRLVALLVLTGSSLALPASTASALSCAAPADWMPGAAHVFVGRIADVRGDTIQVEVSEVWQGEDLAPQVWLRQQEGLDDWYPFSSDGKAPQGDSSPEYVIATERDFVVSPCGMWARGEPIGYGVAGERSPRPPVASGNPGAEPEERSLVPVAAGGVGVVGVAGLVALLWRRRTR
jgi:hypothetical protein